MYNLNPTSKYITKHDDHYSIDLLNVNDSVTIELDMPLHVPGDMFVAGTVNTTSDISVAGPIRIQGHLWGHTVASKTKIVVVGVIGLQGSLRSGGSIIALDSVNLGGNLLADKKISVCGNLTLAKSISAKEILIVNGDIHCDENIAVGLVFAPEGIVVCGGEVKVAGMAVDKYAVVKNNNGTFILMGEMGWNKQGKLFSDVILNLDERVEALLAKEDKSDAQSDFLQKITFARDLATPFVEPKNED